MPIAIRIYLAVSALAFIGIGLNTLHDPVAAMIGIDLQPTTISATNEIRANYGGLQLGVALLLLAGAISTGWRRPALWVSVAITSGLALGRVVSLLLDGQPNTTILVLLAIESASALTALFLLARSVGSR